MCSIPDKFICPISHQIFNNPVIAFDGFNYEKECIEKWFEKNNRSPLTNQILNTNFYPNSSLKNEIHEWLKINPKYKNDIYVIKSYNPNPNSVQTTFQYLTDSNIREEVKQYIRTGYSRYGHISNWDVSNVTDMSNLFENCYNFNQPLGNWNVSNVTNMKGMFDNCYNFNQPLGNWDVRKVENMRHMFDNCENFNQPLGNWDVRNVYDMTFMFYNCHKFNQPLEKWKVNGAYRFSYHKYKIDNCILC